MSAKQEEKLKQIESDFADVICRHRLDILCNMPDYVLAEFVVTCLFAIKTANVNAEAHNKCSL